MDFGKLPNVDRVRFELPAQDPRGLAALAAGKSSASAQRPPADAVRIGAPVWACKEWVGKIYPAKTPQADFLEHYARQFTTIELNATFYRTPDARTIEHWRTTTPETFRFCPKIHQSLSHAADLGTGAPAQIESVCRELALLKERMGVCFLQLPPAFTPASLRILERFIEVAAPIVPLAIEFRHPAWFEGKQQLRKDAFELLARSGVSTVITDVAGRRDVLHSSLTTPRALIRFVGNELHPSDHSRIDQWLERIALWLESGLQELHFFVHEPDSVLVPELAEYLIQGLARRHVSGLPGLRWQKPESPKPQQLSLL